MSKYQWLVICISGVTCGGKTSLALRLKDLLSQHFQCKKQNVTVSKISQDDYFLEPDDCRHVLLPSLGHINWELPTAVNLDGIYSTALKIITGNDSAGSKEEHSPVAEIESHSTKTKIPIKGILLIEGFLVLNHSPTSSLCHLGYYVLLSRATCISRRFLRNYDPPDVPGYFEHCVWPEHLIRRAEVLGKGKIVDESDPITMEINEGEGGSTDSSCATKPSTALNSPNHSSEVVSEVTSLMNLSLENNSTGKQSNFYLRLGGDILPLAKFGKAGLGLRNKIRILSGEATDIEGMASSVFKDVLSEMERLNFE